MKKIIIPKSWENPDEHFLIALESKWYKIILNLENAISYATWDFYKNSGIKTLFLPITTGSVSSPMGKGSDSLPVQISLFGKEIYLADSMQFLLEYGCRINTKGCFYVMPSFRGENADKRHLCQFFHSEAEIPGSLNKVMQLVENYIKHLSNYLLKNCKADIISVTKTVEHIEKIVKMNKFPQIKYENAIKILKKKPNCIEQKDGDVFITNLGEKEFIKLFGGIVWLVSMPENIVPFYQAKISKKSKYTKSADLLFGIGEVVGSGERHTKAEEVVEALTKQGHSIVDYEWYIKMKQKYPIKTSGFGMGIERFLLWVLQHDDIRDCQLLLRFNGKTIIP